MFYFSYFSFGDAILWKESLVSYSEDGFNSYFVEKARGHFGGIWCLWDSTM